MTEEQAAPVVLMTTSLGDLKLELWPETAPISVENFLGYVDSGHYDGTVFHRVIENFMIQGGGFTPDMQQKPTGTPIKNEARADTENRRGTIAMARTSVIDSATAQFFINVKDNDFLDHTDDSDEGFGYCVFGKVTDGMDVVDKIRKVDTGRKGIYDDVPVEPVIIESVKRA